MKADDTEVKSEMPPSNTTDKDGQSESCDLEEEVEYFRKFLNKVQDCLAGRSRQTGREAYFERVTFRQFRRTSS